MILPGSPEYDDARRAFALTADLRPAAIFMTRSADDVRAAMRYARRQGLRVATMATGHKARSLPALHNSVLLRFANPGLDLDPATGVASVRAATSWGHVVDVVAPHGFTAPHGTSRSVSAIGYLLGGGLSFYGRRHGLAANLVRAFTVVLADGEVARVDAEHHPDLFWALRGGGGSFAVVLEAEIELLRYSEVYAGSLLFSTRDARRVLRAWRDWTLDAPDEVTSSVRVVNFPSLPPVPAQLRGTTSVRIDALAVDDAAGRELEAMLRGVATPTDGGIKVISTADASRFNGDPEEPVAGVGGGGDLLRTLDDDAIDAYLGACGEGSPLAVGELRQLGGALAQAPSGSGVYGRLEGGYIAFAGAPLVMSASADELRRAVNRFIDALSPWSTGLRFSSLALQPGVTIADCYPRADVDRLADVREAVDPGHLLLAPHGFED